MKEDAIKLLQMYLKSVSSASGAEKLKLMERLLNLCSHICYICDWSAEFHTPKDDGENYDTYESTITEPFIKLTDYTNNEWSGKNIIYGVTSDSVYFLGVNDMDNC